MISIVIRNKNEAAALERVLQVLFKAYSGQFEEVILVDNQSTDNSVAIAQGYGCKCVTITDFTYGGAINEGIRAASQPWVLLLSAHSYPVGSGFFQATKARVGQDPMLAGIRYINSAVNYDRAVGNQFVIKDGLRHGLMAACALVNRAVALKFPFDEKLTFSEDKYWTQEVIEAGYTVADLPETFFYFARRSKQGELDRWENETRATHQILNRPYPSVLRIIGSGIYGMLFNNFKQFLGRGSLEWKRMLRLLRLRASSRN